MSPRPGRGVIMGMPDQVAIVRIAEQVRREQCGEACRIPELPVGVCEFVSQVLEERLRAAGLASRRVSGYYTGCVEPKRTPSGDPLRTVTTWDGVWMHWWVECEGYVVDVLADRFAAANGSARPIVLLPKSDAVNYQARLPLPCDRGTATTVFQQ